MPNYLLDLDWCKNKILNTKNHSLEFCQFTFFHHTMTGSYSYYWKLFLKCRGHILIYINRVTCQHSTENKLIERKEGRWKETLPSNTTWKDNYSSNIYVVLAPELSTFSSQFGSLRKTGEGTFSMLRDGEGSRCHLTGVLCFFSLSVRSWVD